METNIFIESDALEALRRLPEQSVDLIYADPPFNTGRDFGKDEGGYTDKHAPAGLSITHDIMLKWLREVTTPSQFAYYTSIIPVIREASRLLKKSGALYWHCDWRSNSVVRLILNSIFGQPQFHNEIAWEYQISMPYDNIKNRWKNNYDVILFYAKSDHAFNAQFHPPTYKEIKEKYPYTDSSGRKFRYSDGLYGTRVYADENKGSRIGTCWTDIPRAMPKERTGYPNQKPLSLLRRIISASSSEGDIVLDPYCGSGTTCVVAKQLNRAYIGIDRNPEAIHIAKERTK